MLALLKCTATIVIAVVSTYEIYKRVTTHRNRPLQHRNMAQNLCQICQEMVDNDKERLRCSHMFHRSCIVEVLDNEVQRSCPIRSCRLLI